MPITDRQRESRSKRIGSSDVPALFGCDFRQRNAYDLYLEKTGQVEPVAANQAMAAGNYFEDGVRAWASDELGPIVRNQYRSLPSAHLGVNIDGILKTTGEPVEVKTAGLYGPTDEPWGDYGTDEVPNRVFLQAHAHMICVSSECDICYVPVFIGWRGFGMYQIRRNGDLVAAIIERCTNLWEKHIVPGIPPADMIPSFDVVKRARKTPNKVIVLPASLRTRQEEAKAALAMAEQAKEQADAAVMAALGDAEAGNWDDGQGAITHFMQSRKSVNTKQLAEDHPELAATYMRETTFRVFRSRKGQIKNGD